MTDQSDIDPPPAKGGRKGVVIGLLGAVLLGAGGFYAAYSGMIGGAKTQGKEPPPAEKTIDPAALGVAFVPLDPLVISLGRDAMNRYLRFGAELEVNAKFAEEVTLLKPRIADVLNSYLRAVESRDIEDPAAMSRLRAQMLRRIQVVAGEGRVRDLLIGEFVLN